MSTTTAVKHTPGPWSLNEMLTIYGPKRTDGSARLIAVVWGNELDDDDGPNASLITAAPELLEALTEMISAFVSRNDRQAKAVDSAMAAIRKAKGEL